MNKNIRINLLYGIALVTGLVILGVVGFAMNNVAGYLTYILIAFIGGVATLKTKHQVNQWWVWLLLFLSCGFLFPIAALALPYKKVKVHRVSIAGK